MNVRDVLKRVLQLSNELSYWEERQLHADGKRILSNYILMRRKLQ